MIHLCVQVKIKDKRGNEYNAVIKPALEYDLEHLSKDWKFDWLSLMNSKSKFYQMSFEDRIQGLIKLEEENEVYYILKNIEVAPWNYGSKGKYKNIAALLMSYACLKSFELNKGNYKGHLVFTSKGALIEYYQKKYNAELIFRERMLITPEIGKQLIKTNLKIDLDNG